MTEFDFEGMLDAARRRDVDRMFDYLTEDVVVRSPALGQPLRGREAMRELVRASYETIEELDIEPKVVLQQGEDLAALLDVRARFGQALQVPGTRHRFDLAGATLATEIALFLTLTPEGKVRRMTRMVDGYSVMRQLKLGPQQMAELMEDVQEAVRHGPAA